MWTSHSDEEVLAAFVSGNGGREAAFTELVDRYERRVYGICFRYFGNHADAEDAAQETFVALVRRAQSFRGDSKLSTWIYRVTVNTCNDLARRRDRRPQTPVGDVTELADPVDTAAEDALSASELVHEVQRALGQLDDLSRTLIILVAIEGQGYREVAEALDLPVGTVKSRVHRARARLAELLEPSAGRDAVPGATAARADATARQEGGPTGRPRAPPS